MGQRANSGRNPTLDDKKLRTQARGQQKSPAAESIRDAYSEKFAKGKTAGAFGKSGPADGARRAKRPARRRAK
jgi:hypothetical protein